MANTKEKQYVSDNPKLMAEWDWEKNIDLDPSQLTVGNHKKVYWKCKKEHEWQAAIYSRNNGNGCPCCAGKKAIPGENDLQTINPTLAKEWDYEKNNPLTPMDVLPNSGKTVYWKCEKGHEYPARIDHRNNERSGCPYCSGRFAVKGENDLQTINPTLAKEWNYEKNNPLTPIDVLPNSGKAVWWKCKKGHEWPAVIASRNNGCGCPICSSGRRTSFPEYALIFYLKQYGLEVIQSYKEKGYELDVYIPSKNVAIEYDGDYWHKNKAHKDLDKNTKCKKDGITLYRIREGLPSLNDSSLDYIVDKNQKNFPIILKKVLSEIVGTNIAVDLEKDAIAIENLREFTEKENSLLLLNPAIASEWNYERNGDLKPEYFATSSGKKVWWKCSEGHPWQATVASRNNGHGCPYCAGQKVLKGFNDLQTVNPTLAKEWNYEKNGDLKPEQFTANSGKTVYWKCKKGHEWPAKIIGRNKGSGCPYCAGQRLIRGENDLQTVNPTLAKEWDYEKNNRLTPMDVMPNSHNNVWWKCNKGHPWQAKIYNRNNGRGCPYCASQKILKGYNDLQTVKPTLAKEWDYEKNNRLTPMDVMPNSNKKAHWKCSEGHSWQATIASRNSGCGCPYCAGKKVLKGFNDLQTVNPALAKEWNHKKNGVLKPEHFTTNSGKKVYWKCAKGHEYPARIDHRNNGSGCPQCAGRLAIKGENDLQTINPTLAKEWNYEKNNPLTHMDLMPNSHSKVWWKCKKGHEWLARIGHRNNGSGCPQCAKEKRKKH